MKTFVTTLSLLMSLQAFAGLDITCTTTDADFGADSIKITNLGKNDGRVDIENLDGSVMEQPTVRDHNVASFIAIDFSNECDNGYSFAIPAMALRELQDGRLESITILSEYYNSINESARGPVLKTAALTCRLAQ